MLKIASLKIPKIEELEYKFFNVPEDMKDRIRILDACTFKSTDEITSEETDKDYLLLDFSPLFNKEVKIWVEPKNLLFYGLDKTFSRFLTPPNNKDILKLTSTTNENSFFQNKTKLNKIRDDFQSGESLNVNKQQKKTIRVPIKFNGIYNEFDCIQNYIKFILSKEKNVIFEPDNLILYESSYIDYKTKTTVNVRFLFKNIKSNFWNGYTYVNYLNSIINSYNEDLRINEEKSSVHTKFVTTSFKNYLEIDLRHNFHFNADQFSNEKKFIIATFMFKNPKKVTYINFNYLESFGILTEKPFKKILYFDLNGDYFIKINNYEYLYDTEYTNDRDLFNSLFYKEDKKIIFETIFEKYNSDDRKIVEYSELLLSFLKLNYNVFDSYDKLKYLDDSYTVEYIKKFLSTYKKRSSDLNLDKTITMYYNPFKEYLLPFNSLYLQEKIKDFDTGRNSIANYLYVCKNDGGIIINNNFSSIITNCLKNKNKIKINSYILNSIIGMPLCIINYLNDNEHFEETQKVVETYLRSKDKDTLFYCYDKFGKFLMTSSEYSYVLSNETDIVILISNKLEYLIKFNEFDFMI